MTKCFQQPPKLLIPESHQIHAVQTQTYWLMYQMMKTHHSTSKGLFWRLCLPSVACELDRRNISDTSGAAIVRAFLTNIGLVFADDTYSVIYRSKIQREQRREQKMNVLAVTTQLLKRKNHTLLSQNHRNMLGTLLFTKMILILLRTVEFSGLPNCVCFLPLSVSLN